MEGRGGQSENSKVEIEKCDSKIEFFISTFQFENRLFNSTFYFVNRLLIFDFDFSLSKSTSDFEFLLSLATVGRRISSASFPLFLFSFVFFLFSFSFFFFFFFFFAFFTIAIVKQAHYNRISLHLHPVLYPITLCYIRSAVVLLGLPAYAFSLFTILGLSTIAISDSISSQRRYFGLFKRHAFALYIDLDTFTLLPGWIILMNLGARRQKSRYYDHGLDFVNYSMSSVCGLLVSSSLV